MKARTVVLISLILVLVIALPGSGYAQSEEPHPLLAMLAYFPDTPEIREKVGEFIYIDLEANQEALGQDPFSDNVEIPQSQFGWPTEFSRIRELSFSSIIGQDPRSAFLDRMRELVGFTWQDVDHYLLLYDRTKPYAAAYGGDFDRDAIGTALTAHQFEMDMRNEIPVWHRLEDDWIDTTLRDEADPFAGGVYGARIAVNGNQISYRQNWPMLEASLAGQAGDSASLATADDFRVLAEAITEVGDPILVMFFRETEAERAFFPGGITPEMLEFWQEELGTDLDEWGILPPAPIFALVDYQDSDNQVNAIALVYDNLPTAEAAAVELTHRLETESPSFYEEIGASVNPPFIHLDETGYAAVIASVRYPLDLDSEIESFRDVPGTVLLGWRGIIRDNSYVTLVSDIEISSEP